MTSRIAIGIDVGGTFTDLVAIDGEGRTTIVKSPSTPADPSGGVLEGLADLADRLGLPLPDLLARTERIVHGTTVATNALLERKGARVGLLTTEGHRDVLEMREGLKPDRYDLRLPPPEPLVPRERRLGVRERVKADGSVLAPLDQASLFASVQALKTAGVEAVAVCFLHAYRRPEHERETRRALEQGLPGVFVTLSSEVLPQIKEFERVSTTAVNAYVGPPVARYLTSLSRRLAEAGFAGPLFVILSHGGMAPVEEAARVAAATVLSGPAGGVAAARRCAELLGTPDLVPFDMGGTSTDISLVSRGEAALSADRTLAGERIGLRSLDIASIGAGGGSIARVVAGGLRVGPESAGALPGPACYGRGGTEATVTDANVILGYLDPDRFLGGRQTLDRAAAEVAVGRVGRDLGIGRVEAAAGIHRLVNLSMADGIRLMTVRRGVDPRRFALLSFGGAAGLHAVEVARDLDIPRVIVPTVASVLSAWGMLGTSLLFEAARSHVGDSEELDDDALRNLFGELEREAGDRLRGWFDGPIGLRRSAEMRYGEQVYEIDVPLDGLDWRADRLMERVIERFHHRHRELYTYDLPGEGVVLVNARAAAVGAVPLPPVRRLEPGARDGAARGTRLAHLGGWREVPVFDLPDLRVAQEIVGPALIESETTTVLAGEGDRVAVNEFGWLDILLRASDQERDR